MLYNILAAFVTWTQVRVTFTVSVLPLGRGGRSSLSRGRTWRSEFDSDLQYVTQH